MRKTGADPRVRSRRGCKFRPIRILLANSGQMELCRICRSLARRSRASQGSQWLPSSLAESGSRNPRLERTLAQMKTAHRWSLCAVALLRQCDGALAVTVSSAMLGLAAPPPSNARRTYLASSRGDTNSSVALETAGEVAIVFHLAPSADTCTA